MRFTRSSPRAAVTIASAPESTILRIYPEKSLTLPSTIPHKRAMTRCQGFQWRARKSSEKCSLRSARMAVDVGHRPGEGHVHITGAIAHGHRHSVRAAGGRIKGHGAADQAGCRSDAQARRQACGAVAQRIAPMRARARPCEGRGHTFESCQPCQIFRRADGLRFCHTQTERRPIGRLSFG